ncbi:hypothetical protein [Thioalkalivibrio paradoxus]|uniref:Uncharacterized protein n=1 Tax=Thioalkalivibrio paradoxus ARh 1 TaxID=713585 RepID=W0DEC8_9GAMM|nr:hypothetical protein [Thioalkalivibrio paradoxus]AHE96999.1 hypothetical protein THITH_00480 [Thioalkalivibrio paradoxus ARh 1]
MAHTPGIPDRLALVCPQPERLDPAAPQAGSGLRRASAFQPVEPLWQRLPRRDANGRRLADFMMLIPGLKRRHEHEIRARLAAIQCVLERYAEVVAFVELNLRINTLWVSVQARPGLCLEIPIAIQAAVPEALLIGQRTDR